MKTARSINMNALEGAGFVHLYGLSSVLNALSANRRDFQTSKENMDTGLVVDDDRFSDLSPNADNYQFDEDDDNDFDTATRQKKEGTTNHEVKPQAQFRPYLFVQDRSTGPSKSGRRGSKAAAASEIIDLAQQRDIPIEYVDKGILNTLSGNRPHQGYVLRCGKLAFNNLSRIAVPTRDDADNDTPSIWLVLDEVVDPQNLGALLRSAYFLGGGNQQQSSLGVLVCSKNSAPPSPVVSASSAGALELLDVFSTNNLPRTLSQAREDGFRVIGASSSVPQQTSTYGRQKMDDEEEEDDDSDNWDNDDLDGSSSTIESSAAPPLYDLQELPTQIADDRPILLVLGSEGQGLRNLVAKACTEFVRIPSGLTAPSVPQRHGDDDDESTDGNHSEAGVDSLNVSVSAGIMLWHLLSGRN
jgi:21S rRNA (GM2251-2'-O)-methyltransferase